MKVLDFISQHPDYTPPEFIDISVLELCFNELKLKKPVAFIFMADDEHLELNKLALQHDYLTDIITFDFSDDADYTHSEVYVNVDRVKENGPLYNSTFSNELMRVCLHGLLHLGGYNDKTKLDTEKIRAAENHYLALCRST